MFFLLGVRRSVDFCRITLVREFSLLLENHKIRERVKQ